MNHVSHFDTPIANAPIPPKARLILPEIAYYAKRARKFLRPDDPELDGAHIHDDYEIYLHLAGNGAFLVNNRVYPLNRGDIILSRPGDVHVFVLNCAEEFDHVCLWLSPACGSRLLSLPDDGSFSPHLTFGKETAETVIHLLCQLADKETPHTEQETLSALLQLAVTVSAKENHTEDTSLPMPDEMQRILNYLDTELYRVESVESLAKEFNISPATLSRRFRQYIHLSPGEFIKAKRLSYAKKLLDNGATVTESCMQSGFSDCSYFISSFRAKFGHTPHQYKKKHSPPKD